MLPICHYGGLRSAFFGLHFLRTKYWEYNDDSILTIRHYSSTASLYSKDNKLENSNLLSKWQNKGLSIEFGR